MKPQRIQLKRAKGWRMPENTVKVDRSTKWGNPFVVSRDGTRADCVQLFAGLMGGLVCLTCKVSVDQQKAYAKMVAAEREQLRGKNLGCWCAPNVQCHADILLEIANGAAPTS